MLGKLIKHELRATARIMLPLYAALLLLALLANISIRLFGSADSNFLNILNGLILFFYGLAAFAAGVMSIVLMIQRFRANLLGDEGYLMFTLPAGIHSHIWSKIIVSLVWFAATIIAELLAVFIMLFKADQVQHIISEIARYLEIFRQQFNLDFLLMGAELLTVILLAGIMSCLLFYAAMALGHSFANRKILYSVGFFLALQFVSQLLGTTGILTVDALGLDLHGLSAMGVTHTLFAGLIGVELFYCAVYYGLTAWSLKRRLNLE